VLDPSGNGQLYQRDLALRKSDWFYVGIADLTVARDDTTGRRGSSPRTKASTTTS